MPSRAALVLRVLSLVFASSSIVAACNNRGAVSPVAPLEVNVAEVGEGGLVPSVAARPPRSPRAPCTARLYAGELEKSPTCNVDTKITEGPGTLTYPCGGEGAAEARFGEQRLAGAVHGGLLRLEVRTNPDWNDGCGWESRQLIEGDVKDASVSWTYDESLLKDNGGCFSPCEATTSLKVEREE